MAAQIRTPGVYVEELNAFPNSVVEVATGVPVFIGHTEKAMRGKTSLTGVPTRFSSMMDFIDLFGGPARPKINIEAGTPPNVDIEDDGKYLLYQSMRLYFDNGGGDCWVVSVGDYDTALTPKALSAPVERNTGILEKTPEPTIVCIPEAVKLDAAGWADVTNKVLAHCVYMKSRVAIIDIFDGDKGRDKSHDNDVITGTNAGLRQKINADDLSYGAAYYPWLNTNILTMADLSLDRITPEGVKILAEILAKESAINNNKGLAKLAKIIAGPDALPKINDDKLAGESDKDHVARIEALMHERETELAEREHSKQPDSKAFKQRQKAHEAASQLSSAYTAVMEEALKQLNLLPPSAAMAGVYARTDSSLGVFKAPANTGLTSVLSPSVSISHDEQEDLNIPLDGKAVNAIRSFAGRGVLVWGARTMDGNSNDWRYINVRRTLIMLEQSIKFACEPYVFAPNTASTWVTVKAVISNFLLNQWKAGALAGSSPEDAFAVDVGLGSSMTANDVLNGYMNVTVRVAVVRPAEFIVLTFQQKMQTS